MNNQTIANYRQDQDIFTNFVASDFDPNILLVHGATGIGKSAFIKYCLQNVPERPYILLDLHNGIDFMPTLFIRLGKMYGWEKLPNFTKTVAILLEQPDELENPLWIIQMRRHLREIGKINDIESRLSRYSFLADAWFFDAELFEKPVLIIIDKYENSSTLFDRWLCQDFLIGVADSQRMQVLISGQKVPATEYEWNFTARVHQLKGVHEAEVWLDWAVAAGYQVPSMEEMVELVEILEGNPSQIIEVIQTQFPRASSVLKTELPSADFTNKMVQAFNLAELKNICFDLGIRYEDLPDHEILSRLAKEMAAYAARLGRLQELIQLCRRLRPAVFQTAT
jgi:hypothetical protein